MYMAKYYPLQVIAYIGKIYLKFQKTCYIIIANKTYHYSSSNLKATIPIKAWVKK